jgi:hypothetical protein
MRYLRLVVVWLVLLLGMFGFDSRSPAASGVSNIVVIVMENKEYNQIIGSSQAPYINSLANQYTLLTQYYAILHPSMPNYLTITGGSTFGRKDNCTDCFVDAANLGDQLEKAGLSWKTYQESMPKPCFVGDAYPYVQKHNGFIYYRNVKDDAARCRVHVVAGEGGSPDPFSPGDERHPDPDLGGGDDQRRMLHAGERWEGRHHHRRPGGQVEDQDQHARGPLQLAEAHRGQLVVAASGLRRVPVHSKHPGMAPVRSGSGMATDRLRL